MTDTDQQDRTLWVGNLDSTKVTDEILFELFLQAGPLVHVKIAKEKDGKQKNFAFVEFKHDVSVPYSLQLMNGMPLFGRNLRCQFRSGSKHTRQPPQQMPGGPGMMGNPGMMGGPGFHVSGSGGMPMTGVPPAFQGDGLLPPPIHRSASAPGDLIQMGHGHGGGPGGGVALMGTPTMYSPAGTPGQASGNYGNMYNARLGLAPGTPFSQGAAFEGLAQRGRRGDHMGQAPPTPPHLMGRGRDSNPPSPGMSPDRRGSDSRWNDRSNDRGNDRGRGHHNLDRQRSYRQEDMGELRRSDSSVDSYEQGRDSRNFHPDRDRYEGGRSRWEGRRDREYQGRVEERYRDRSGGRHDQERRGRDEGRSNQRNYHSGR